MVNRIEQQEPSFVHVGKLHVIAAGAGIREDIWNLYLQFKSDLLPRVCALGDEGGEGMTNFPLAIREQVLAFHQDAHLRVHEERESFHSVKR